MNEVRLREIDGAVVLPLPPAAVDALAIGADATVRVSVLHGRLIVEPLTSRHYSLEELLATSDGLSSQLPCDREWVDAAPVGGELI